jgi:dipeptidyl aminopeptidase/acylaminoacyl peptidase
MLPTPLHSRHLPDRRASGSRPPVTMRSRRRTPATALVVLFLALALVPALGAQENGTPRPLDHDAYDRWNRIAQQGLSPDGAWLRYRLAPGGEATATVYLVELDGNRQVEIERGISPSFTADGRFAVVRVQPRPRSESEDEEAAAGGEGAEGAAGEAPRARAPNPTDSVAVVDLRSGAIRHLDRVRAVNVPGGSTEWILVHRTAEEANRAGNAGNQTRGNAGSGGGDARRRTAGTELTWWNLATDERRSFQRVTTVHASDDGTELLFVVSSPDGDGGVEGGSDGVWMARADEAAPTLIHGGVGEVARLSTSDDWSRAAFLSNAATWEADTPEHALFVAHLEASSPADRTARPVAAPGSPGLPEGWLLSENGTVRFSDSGARLFFGVAPRPEPEPEEKDELLENVQVDVWSWHDPFLQPHQLNDLQQERRRSWQVVAHLDARDPARSRLVPLEDRDLLSVSVPDGGDAPYGIGIDDQPYRQRVSWDTRYTDLYLVDLESGTRERVLEEIRGSAAASPTGRWIRWWDGEARGWMVMDPRTREVVNATAAIPVPVFNELDDRPGPPGSYGLAGWTGDDAGMVVHDAWDLWLVDPAGAAAPRNLTAGYGREHGTRLRVQWLDEERTLVPGEDHLLSAFDDATKAAGFYRGSLDGTAPRRILLEDAAFGGLEAAAEGDRLLYTRRTFRDFPDLWVSGADFAGARRVTEANPQQAEYRWGTAELVQWTSTDGEPLQGILYKPDGFDPSEAYPMMVYFYERSSNGLHNYVIPSAGTSINRSFYVSRGYLLFIPDIPYREGYPGESAMNAVMPGVLSLVEQGFVDRERIGVQGHSWGGYQITYMLTRTNLFAAAEAGAPVTNMTSAYGGIRWESGRVRQMQYETGQSRIGASLWEAQHRYIENSPLFTAYKVETPLLMLHNDEDGAVPWEEGIQFFVALRRLGKPVWLLNYNGEAHGLRRSHNQRDWTIRMQQFFDHYLMDAPPPVWLLEGVPAVAKGRTLGLDLVLPAADDDTNGANGGGR